MADLPWYARFLEAVRSTYAQVFAAPFPKLIYAGLNPGAIPKIAIKPFHPGVVGSATGPNAGIRQLKMDLDAATDDKELPVAGVLNWRFPISEADGSSITLYEHHHLTTNHHGDPIADVFAVVARPNNAVLAVADGCNWGPKPRQAARCAVRGSIEYLNGKLFDAASMPRNTQDLVHTMLRSFDSAQKMIVKHDGTTTTLCLAVVCEMAEKQGGGGAGGENGWGLCVVSVGDSPCFVWQSRTGLVHEVTSAAHEGKVRDLRDSGGCLGTNFGSEPDLSNLICCFVPVSEGDVIFLTSDGVSDNFDPVILREGVVAPPPSTPLEKTYPPSGARVGEEAERSLPVFNAKQRQAQLLTNISGLLHWTKLYIFKDTLDATEVKDAVVSYVIDATNEKRSYLEKAEREADALGLNEKERRERERSTSKVIKALPGKLDHATVVCYKVGPLVGRPQIVEQTSPSRMCEAMKTYNTVKHDIRARQSLYEERRE